MPVSTAHNTCGQRLRGFAERAVLGDEREQVASGLGVRRESVGGQRVGDRRNRGLHRTVALGRFHPRRDRPAVVVADLFGERRASSIGQPFERPGEQRGEQVVALGREGEVVRRSRRRGSASTAGPRTRGARARRRGSCPPRASPGGGGRRSGAARSARPPRPPWRRRATSARRGRCRGGSGRRRRS